MTQLLTTSLGRLRLVSLLDGLSLLLLVGVAVPLKYWGGDASWVKLLGPIHGALFVLFGFATLSTAIGDKWPLSRTLLVGFVSSLVPFGMIYIDLKVLAPLQVQQQAPK